MVVGIPSVYIYSIMILLVGIMKSFDKSFVLYSEKMLKKQCVSFAVDYIM